MSSRTAAAPGVVVVARNERAHLRRTLENLRDTLPPAADVLVVDDGSSDGSARLLKPSWARVVKARGLGVAGSRNLGARRVAGRVVIFCDAHIWLEKGWWQPLCDRLEDPRTGAAAPVIADSRECGRRGAGLYLAGAELEAHWLPVRDARARRVPVLPGCCLALRRDTFETAGGFDGGMIASGGVDNEFCLRLWLLGYQQWVLPRVEVRHLFRSRQPYPVRSATILHNRLRLALIHFSATRIRAVMEALRQYQDFPAAMRLAARGDCARLRVKWSARRIHDDNWFFRRFEQMRNLRHIPIHDKENQSQ